MQFCEGNQSRKSSTFAPILSRRLLLNISGFDVVPIEHQANENAVETDFRV